VQSIQATCDLDGPTAEATLYGSEGIENGMGVPSGTLLRACNSRLQIVFFLEDSLSRC